MVGVSFFYSIFCRTSSEEELRGGLDPSKRPVSPGTRGTTWNARPHGRVGRDGGVSEDEADGFDDHYFRRRPKSFCLPPAAAAAYGGPRPYLHHPSAIHLHPPHSGTDKNF